MHIHANQNNPNIQLNNLYAAEKAAAKRETERTRKKLLEFASALAGESGDAWAVKLGARDESHAQEKRENQQTGNRHSQGSGKIQNEGADSEDGDHSISDWA